MVLIRTEIPIDDLPADHPARNQSGPTNQTLPHPAHAQHPKQENYESQFKCEVENEDIQSFGYQPPAHARSEVQVPTPLFNGWGKQNVKKQMMEEGLTPKGDGGWGIGEKSYRQMQLMLLEQQNKKRLLYAARSEETGPNVGSAPQYPCQQQQPPSPSSSVTSRDTNAHVTYPVSVPDPANAGNSPSSSFGNHTLQDYQAQLMLLETQNKRRRQLAQAEQVLSGSFQQSHSPSSHNPSCFQPTPHPMYEDTPQGYKNHALEDYESQLTLLERQNKKRLMLKMQAEEEEVNKSREEEAFKRSQLDLSDQQCKSRLIKAQHHQEAQKAVHACQLLPGSSGTTCTPPAAAAGFSWSPVSGAEMELPIRGGPLFDD